jgi:hypothetical protein
MTSNGHGPREAMTAAVYETDVLCLPHPSDEQIDMFCIVDFERCGADIPSGAAVWLWGEPTGEHLVAINVFCSQECVRERLHNFVQRIKRDLTINWRSE